MDAHTPGPWDYEWSNDVGPNDDYYIEFFEVFAADKTKIAQVEKPEDACLIAAAPELLDVLTLALPYVEDAVTDSVYKAGAVTKMVNKIRAAIDKATGVHHE